MVNKVVDFLLHTAALLFNCMCFPFVLAGFMLWTILFGLLIRVYVDWRTNNQPWVTITIASVYYYVLFNIIIVNQ